MLGEQIQQSDWKTEKHVPVIDCPAKVKADEVFAVTITVGKEIPHPNPAGHYIGWISLFFLPEGDKFTYEVGRFEFNAHGESVQGPDEGPVYTHHMASTAMRINKPGTLIALSSCNIHGLWESQKEVGLL